MHVNKVQNTLKTIFALALSLSVLGACSKLNTTSSASSNPGKPQVNSAKTVPSTDSSGDYTSIEITEAVIEQQRSLKNASDVQKTPRNIPYVYEIGAGDLIFISISVAGTDPDNPRMTQIYPTSSTLGDVDQAQYVSGNGEVSLPYLGNIKATDKTESQLSTMLTKKYKTYFRNPYVSVKILGYISRYILVAGEVGTPGRQLLNNIPLTVLDAIRAAGGIKDTADLSMGFISHKDGTRTAIDLRRLLYGGDSKQNVVLHPSDVLHIPYSTNNAVYVGGEVNGQQRVSIPQGQTLTLADALYKASGLNLTTATKDIYVLRRVNMGPKELMPQNAPAGMKIYHIDLANMQSMQLATQFTLASNDVVYTTTRGITDWSRFINQLLPGNSVTPIITSPKY